MKTLLIHGLTGFIFGVGFWLMLDLFAGEIVETVIEANGVSAAVTVANIKDACGILH